MNALMTQGGRRAMPRPHPDLVAERQEPVAYGRDQQPVVAAGKIGSADRFPEQHIPWEEDPSDVERDAAGGVSGRVDDTHRETPDRDLVTVLERPIHFGDRHGVQSERLRLEGKPLQQKTIFVVDPERYAQPLAKLRRGPHMIEVPVRGENRAHRHFVTRRHLQNQAGVASRIHDHRLARPATREEIAILLEHAHDADIHERGRRRRHRQVEQCPPEQLEQIECAPDSGEREGAVREDWTPKTETRRSSSAPEQ
jgi:hypothetical protein